MANKKFLGFNHLESHQLPRSSGPFRPVPLPHRSNPLPGDPETIDNSLVFWIKGNTYLIFVGQVTVYLFWGMNTLWSTRYLSMNTWWFWINSSTKTCFVRKICVFFLDRCMFPQINTIFWMKNDGYSNLWLDDSNTVFLDVTNKQSFPTITEWITVEVQPQPNKWGYSAAYSCYKVVPPEVFTHHPSNYSSTRLRWLDRRYT